MLTVSDFATTYLRLRPDAVEPLPVDGTLWPRIMRGELGDFHHEYLIAQFSFDCDWPVWEQHPHGDEVVCLLSGAVELVLELPNGHHSVMLERSGSYAVVPKGTWHTARTRVPCTMLFITPGEGTQHRPV